MNYSDKLKDPRWQKKRLEILQRDEFMCQNCHDTESTLHVHHIKYNGQPWQAEEKYLVTVCKDCHKELEEKKKELKNLLDEMESNWLETFYCSIEVLWAIHTNRLNPYEISAIRAICEKFTKEDYTKYFDKFIKNV